MAEAAEKSLSPVLNRKRIGRHQSGRNKRLMSPEPRASNKSHAKHRTSGIPVPIKASQECNLRSSLPPVKSNSVTGDKSPSSDQKDKIFKVGAIDDSLPKTRNWQRHIEIRCASGDVANPIDRESKHPRENEEGLDTLRKKGKFEKTNLDLIDIVPHTSKQVDSDDTLAVKVFCNNSFKSSDSSGDSCMLKGEHPATVGNDSLGDVNSLLDYNDETSDHPSILATAESSSCSTSKNVIRLNLTESVKEQFRTWLIHRTLDEGGDFEGFTDDEIRRTEEEYQYAKEMQKQLKIHFGVKPETVSIPAPTLQLVDDKEELPGTPDDCQIISLPVSPMKVFEQRQISVSPNKRVQINIGHNRIKINIKSDNKVPVKSALEKPLVLPAIKYSDNENILGGFKTASGKAFVIDEVKLQAAKALYDSINGGKSTENTTPNKSKLKLVHESSSDEPIEEIKSEPTVKASDQFRGFQTAAGNPLTLSSTALQKAVKLFDVIDKESEMFDVTSSTKHVDDDVPPMNSALCLLNANNLRTQSAEHGSDSKSSSETSNSTKSHSQDETKMLRPTSARKQLNCDMSTETSESALRKSSTFPNTQTIGTSMEVFDFGNIQQFDFTAGFTSASGKSLCVDAEKLKQAATKFNDLDNLDDKSISATKSSTTEPSITNSDKSAHQLIKEVVDSYDTTLEKMNIKKQSSLDIITTPVRPLRGKEIGSGRSSTSIRKRYGMGRITPMFNISKERLENTKLMFSESEKSLSLHSPNKSNSNRSSLLDSRNSSVANSTSTPRVEAHSVECSKLDLTPIKNNSSYMNKVTNSLISAQTNTEDEDSVLIFHEKSCSNFKKLQNDIDLQYLSLKRKLDVLEERKRALEDQKVAIDTSNSEHKRRRLGILSIAKKSNKRMALRQLQPISVHRDEDPAFICDKKILQVTPRNAEDIHIIAQSERAVIKTVDGAVVIPNTRNTIGVTEISNAFQAMPGVDPQLIPKGWVGNHYKWIVWKLASYDRRLQIRDSLSVENIIQQLKYRYDREIDGALRPALRRILEKDDVASKRLILCVADIIAIGCNKYELSLTDGWYEVRTIIDALLCQEIQKQTLTVGTKLIVQGAELVDCEGCHPLEALDHVKLRIGYNSTRRVRWDTRLGYYHNPLPFPLRLNSLHPNGGSIACIKVYIVRIYPLRYMEELNGVKSWRNEKAEEKRCREFDSERMKTLESLKKQVLAQYECEEKLKTFPKIDKHINSISCPRTLYRMVENSNDPEGIFELLSSEQQSLILKYKNQIVAERQQEISIQMAKRVEELKVQKRTSIPVLKMLVTDALEESNKCFVLNVWKPSEGQLQMFAEECCISVYNAILKKMNELSTISRSMFKMHDGAVMKRSQRQVLPISLTIDVYNQPCFNEFDTVGIIVDFAINHYDQDLWLADFVGRLLYVRIVDGPQMCALIDNVKVGQIITACNLILQKPHHSFGQALANQFSVITQMPSQKYMQAGLELFRNQVQDLPTIIQDGQAKIELLRGEIDRNCSRPYQDLSITNRLHSSKIDDSFEENASIPSGLTLTDLAMSMIDTDQFL